MVSLLFCLNYSLVCGCLCCVLLSACRVSCYNGFMSGSFAGFLVVDYDEVLFAGVDSYVASQAGMVEKWRASGKSGVQFLLEDCLGFRCEYRSVGGKVQDVYVWKSRKVAVRWWVFNVLRQHGVNVCGVLSLDAGTYHAWFDFASDNSDGWWKSAQDMVGFERMVSRLDLNVRVFLSLLGLDGLLVKTGG